MSALQNGNDAARSRETVGMRWLLPLLAFFLPVLILLAVCFQIDALPFGNKTFLIHDMNQMCSI